MQFKKRFIDLGKVKKGEKRSFQYEFVNRGDTDLVVSLVSACDCTTADYPSKPIKPGTAGVISIVFDSSEKDEGEIIDVDIILENVYPGSDDSIIERVQYKFDLE